MTRVSALILASIGCASCSTTTAPSPAAMRVSAGYVHSHVPWLVPMSAPGCAAVEDGGDRWRVKTSTWLYDDGDLVVEVAKSGERVLAAYVVIPTDSKDGRRMLLEMVRSRYEESRGKEIPMKKSN